MTTGNSRAILEIAKAAGEGGITAGHKLFTRGFFTKGRTVELDSTHRVTVMKDGAFTAPYIFVASGDIFGGEPDIAQCESEAKALIAVQFILEQEEVPGKRRLNLPV